MKPKETPQISSLIRASADDLKCSLKFCTTASLSTLRDAHAIVEAEGQKTKAAHLRSRIRQLEKLVEENPNELRSGPTQPIG